MYRHLSKSRHPHVIQCLGMCRRTPTQTEWAVYEHTMAGNLKTFLAENSDQIGHNVLLDFARQIAEGMRFIGQQRFVHKDLAARNCVVDVLPNGGLTVKVGNLGLIGGEDYTTYEGQRLPLRWMAPESLFEAAFDARSDVWSFGVLCFELLTWCREKPYGRLDDTLLMALLRTGDGEARLGTHRFRDVERDLIGRCMAWNRVERLSFDDILQWLDDLTDCSFIRWTVFSCKMLVFLLSFSVENVPVGRCFVFVGAVFSGYLLFVNLIGQMKFRWIRICIMILSHLILGKGTGPENLLSERINVLDFPIDQSTRDEPKLYATLFSAKLCALLKSRFLKEYTIKFRKLYITRTTLIFCIEWAQMQHSSTYTPEHRNKKDAESGRKM